MKASALVGCLLLAVLAASCGGGGSSAPAAEPSVTSATASRDTDNGYPALTSTVQVRFDRSFTPSDSRVPLTSMFELAIKGLSGTDQRVFVQDAKQAGDNPRIFNVSVGQLVPDGATLKVSRKLFDPNADGDIEVTVSSDLSDAQALLASTALGLTRPDIIDKGSAPAVTAADRDPAAMRKALADELDERGSADDTKTAALAAYDGMSTTLVPSPKLRATLAALTGSFAEPAINWLLTDKNCTGKPVQKVDFQVPPDNPDLFARVTFAEDGSRIVSVNPSVEGEPIERLMPLLAHEAIHCDQASGIFEEVAATAFDTFLFLQEVAFEPDLAQGGTPLAVDLNVDVIAMINSGAAVPESVGVLPSPGVTQAVPGTTSSVGSFAELVANAYAGLEDSTPDEQLAQMYAQTFADVAGAPQGSAFDLTYLDALLGTVMDPRLLASVIQAYNLSPA